MRAQDDRKQHRSTVASAPPSSPSREWTELVPPATCTLARPSTRHRTVDMYSSSARYSSPYCRPVLKLTDTATPRLYTGAVGEKRHTTASAATGYPHLTSYIYPRPDNRFYGTSSPPRDAGRTPLPVGSLTTHAPHERRTVILGSPSCRTSCYSFSTGDQLYRRANP